MLEEVPKKLNATLVHAAVVAVAEVQAARFARYLHHLTVGGQLPL